MKRDDSYACISFDGCFRRQPVVGSGEHVDVDKFRSLFHPRYSGAMREMSVEAKVRRSVTISSHVGVCFIN